VSDHQDVSKAIDDDIQAPHHPQVRIFLLTAERPAVSRLSGALPDYQIVMPRSNDDVAFIRQVTIESKERFRLECDRVAASIAALVIGDSSLGCLCDDAAGRTLFYIELRKTSTNEKFIETDAGSDAG
jgi:hypothetical protein